MSLPEHCYVFVNLRNPQVKNNIQLSNGILSTGYAEAHMDKDFRENYIKGDVDYLPFVANIKRQPGIISMFSISVASEYAVEYGLENYRRINFPHLPSRLSGVYAFPDYETCRDVSMASVIFLL